MLMMMMMELLCKCNYTVYASFRGIESYAN